MRHIVRRETCYYTWDILSDVRHAITHETRYYTWDIKLQTRHVVVRKTRYYTRHTLLHMSPNIARDTRYYTRDTWSYVRHVITRDTHYYTWYIILQVRHVILRETRCSHAWVTIKKQTEIWVQQEFLKLLSQRFQRKHAFISWPSSHTQTHTITRETHYHKTRHTSRMCFIGLCE